jgi:hypothetical protein
MGAPACVSALHQAVVQLELANRPEYIRIHLALSRVCFSPLRFNSSGNFCDSAIASRGTPSGEQDPSDAVLWDLCQCQETDIGR